MPDGQPRRLSAWAGTGFDGRNATDSIPLSEGLAWFGGIRPK
jgi:hypothetical protein